MKAIRILMLLGLGLSVSACASVNTVSRNAPFEQLPLTGVAPPAGYELAGTHSTHPRQIADTATRDAGTIGLTAQDTPAPKPEHYKGGPYVTVNKIIVRVPKSLKVSEANVYLPKGDIVWREDPMGDRHAQVQKIVEDAMVRGATNLNGPVNVDLDIQVKRFHALTQKARYTVGGVHAITFYLAIKHPQTGELLVPVREIEADLQAYGGKVAMMAEARGETQKVRITEHLARVIQIELTNPDGYKNATLGFYQMLNRI